MTEAEIVEAMAKDIFRRKFCLLGGNALKRLERLWTREDYEEQREECFDDARAALAIAISWTREQALREAAAVCEDYERDGQNTKAYACEIADELATRILALASPRSQGDDQA